MEEGKKFEYRYHHLDDDFPSDADEQHQTLKESFDYAEPTQSGLEEFDTPHQNATGLTIITAGLFIVGEIAGAGTVALPAAMSKASYAGFIIMILVVGMSLYCGLLLGWSWEVVKDRRKNSTEPIKDPFPAIGEAAAGICGRHAVSICLNVQIFLTVVVYLLLSSEIISSFVSFHIGDIHSSANLRIWLLILSLLVLPFTWLGTPKDFWFIALAAAATTACAVLLIIVKYTLIAPKDLSTVEKAPVTFLSMASAFGTFVFAFTGASLFPTVQSDMKKPKQFAKAIVVGYIATCFLYVPTAAGGFAVLGKDIEDSILETLSHYDKVHHLNRAIVSVIEILFALHFICGLVLMINPLAQQMEGFFNVPHKFCWQRVALRSSLLGLALLTAEAFPKFGPIIDLVGGSVNVFLCFIFPIIFYLKLHPETRTLDKVLMAAIVIFAVLAGISSTASNVINMKNVFHQLYLSKNATHH